MIFQKACLGTTYAGRCQQRSPIAAAAHCRRAVTRRALVRATTDADQQQRQLQPGGEADGDSADGGEGVLDAVNILDSLQECIIGHVALDNESDTHYTIVRGEPGAAFVCMCMCVCVGGGRSG